MHPALAGRCWAVIWVSVLVGASGCFGGSEGGVSSESPSAGAQHISVVSTLAGLDVAPDHVHWVALPSLKEAVVREVRFYVDGKLSWIDPQKPYMYGGDGGYLVTAWMAGIGTGFSRHTFTTEAVAVDGSLGREAVVLRVPSVKEMPDLPYGIWAIRGSPAGPAGPRAIDVLSPGVLWIGAPIENATAYEIRADGSTLRILAPIRKRPGGTGFTEQGWHFDSYDCGPDGPFAVYTWSFGSGPRAALRLKAVHDSCAVRRLKLEGTWEGRD
jgi:hypothetical protein